MKRYLITGPPNSRVGTSVGVSVGAILLETGKVFQRHGKRNRQSTDQLELKRRQTRFDELWDEQSKGSCILQVHY